MSEWQAWLETFHGHWFWLSLGVLLAALEIIAPGFFLIWLAVAALATGLLSWVFPIDGWAQAAIFAVLAVVAVYVGRRYFKLNPIESTDPNLNDRGARLIGEIVPVVEAIESGRGRVRVGDSVWNARGPDSAVGVRVRVAGSEGSCLIVEPLAL